MAVIEGVDDEVTVVFGLLFLLLVVVLAWVSTHTTERGERVAPPTRASEEQDGEREEESEHEEETEQMMNDASKHETPSEEGECEERGEVNLDNDKMPEADEPSPGPSNLRQRPSRPSPGEGSEEPEPPAQPHPELTDSPQDNYILLRLKFLNDTERIARVKAEDTVGHIKRTYFPDQEHQVRLIYQGQLLGDNHQTLASLHILNNCVIHCHISPTATLSAPAGSPGPEHTESMLNIGRLMLPFFFLMLVFLWYYQITYWQFFTAPATISLVGITILFSFVVFGTHQR
ncbi:transmembrane and ubiquitin-like domain-containing protein 1 [Callorhinchus milii]|uniref:Transmembrane and ubiquitin-like domain containing 1 n=1 Tax=Callorhinchus milii TaxID=7868 RepID=V9L3B2_CALMI|nr:transmembrane and ubiquitin-like domain-containing protein 1 [Callorhinchus milii]|eukprot:gi/632984019/ref/XP_007908933.1/ PREDICTED: transmembrane and ubiquitin-like domain-containing protein 1 [Callorhinchus milii]